MKIFLSILLVLLIIYIVPIIIYGLFSNFIGAKMPEGVSPLMFLLSVLISKIGTAIAFVLIFYFARNSFSGHWILYSLVWFIMFVLGEIGQTLGPSYSWKEAIAGVISEAVYLPLSAYLINLMLKA